MGGDWRDVACALRSSCTALGGDEQRSPEILAIRGNFSEGQRRSALHLQRIYDACVQCSYLELARSGVVCSCVEQTRDSLADSLVSLLAYFAETGKLKS